MSAPTVTPELRALLRRVKLGRCLDTLPERLALAQTGGMGHAEFLELVLADEVARRETTSADRRSRAAGLDASMTLDRWDDTAKVTYDHAVWNELCSLRFADSGHNAVIMGPVGVGKTFLATALGHAAVRRRYSVHFERCNRLLKRLRASRLDNSHDTEMRKLLRVDLLIIDLCRQRDYPEPRGCPVGLSADGAARPRCGCRCGRDSHRPSRKARSLSLGR
jgi:DNA replication protein DnaC